MRHTITREYFASIAVVRILRMQRKFKEEKIWYFILRIF
jgi:hypothetical protein